ncbi:MAG: YihY family inner membrane protein [Hydrogenophaga sp.]|jgi:membrane protein|uniref:YihY family inner membrane protein n=1 Tax=Hydrogenophaga sp. TaxID=1904254 RepID=UPI0025C39A41|nr:YihY family inner membrane protein [Hydrogenophaga sp.]MDO8887458.1 YihY family inner membrane protein [Hydrogenophaga sp.]MDO9131411.1 YihY family inner membrane protein [Hydrogenophaga sp.]MDP1783031.1 YihY family inner membrane protein [Hydrogenophaga sp.]MDP2073453.1 YihY family inner membrane protein [Hydrogenophaga sp.]MDP2252148.1 YihY family inner membrane protein [Hydrogenophaga sp.]
MTFKERLRALETLARALWRDALNFPWANTAITLRERFREDRLGITASSLTFTTTISLVPLFTVALAIFSAFPMFDRLQVTLQRWLVQSLVPPDIAKQVFSYLNQFAGKAGQIGWAGALVLLVTALALILTIDRKLNDIWRVRQPRSFTQRVLVYWAVLTLGPLLLAVSLTVTTYAVTASRGVVSGLPGGVRFLLDAVQFALLTGGIAALYRYVPNTRVRWSHALIGGIFVATGLELAKKLLAWYLAQVPTYSVVYGTFATVPILLVWFYVAWVIVLLGAVVAAYLPSLLSGIARRGDTPGWSFQLALEVLEQLHTARDTAPKGLSLEALAQVLRVDALQLEEPVAALVALDWLGRLDEDGERYVLLVDPAGTPMAPMVERLLLARQPNTTRFWSESHWAGLTLAQALASTPLPTAAQEMAEGPSVASG